MRNYLFLKSMLLQREPFLTLFILSTTLQCSLPSPFCKLIFVLSNHQTSTFPLKSCWSELEHVYLFMSMRWPTAVTYKTRFAYWIVTITYLSSSFTDCVKGTLQSCFLAIRTFTGCSSTLIYRIVHKLTNLQKSEIDLPSWS